MTGEGWDSRGPEYESVINSGGYIGDAEGVGKGAGIGVRADVSSEDVRRGGGEDSCSVGAAAF